MLVPTKQLRVGRWMRWMLISLCFSAAAAASSHFPFSRIAVAIKQIALELHFKYFATDFFVVLFSHRMPQHRQILLMHKLRL